MEDVFDVVNYILSQNQYTPKQVQKLLYYAYALYLVKYNEQFSNKMQKLFVAEFQAWEHGPVIPKVYDYMKNFGLSNQKLYFNQQVRLKNIKNENYIQKVLAVLGRYSGKELEDMTHLEDPWKNAYHPCEGTKICKNVINDKDIFNYFYKKYKTVKI